MKIHPQITHLNSVVTVTLVPQFIGDLTDDEDRLRISSYGDPLINLGGTFSDGATPAPFVIQTTAPEIWVGLISGLQNKPVRFMSQITSGQLQGALDVVTSDPVRAAQIYVPAIQARIAAVMSALRLKSPTKLTTLSDSTV